MPTRISSSNWAPRDGWPPASSQPAQNAASTQNSRARATVSQDGQISRCTAGRCARLAGQPSSQRPVRRAAIGAAMATPAV